MIPPEHPPPPTHRPDAIVGVKACNPKQTRHTPSALAQADRQSPPVDPLRSCGALGRARVRLVSANGLSSQIDRTSTEACVSRHQWSGRPRTFSTKAAAAAAHGIDPLVFGSNR